MAFAGQVWDTDNLGGYMYSDSLSRKLRTAVQPLVRFRPFCDAQVAKGKNKGETFNWNAYGDVGVAGAALVEASTMPETKFTITQASLTITEYGNSVPYTGKLNALSEHPVSDIIHKVLKNDARKALDSAAHAQFLASKLRVKGTGSGASTVIAITEGASSIAASGANVAMESGHVKLIADEMEERDIPTFDGENYVGLFRPKALRKLKNDLEALHKYVSEGWYVIMNGEKGRYEGIRFVQQTSIARVSGIAGGWETADATGARDRGFFFGSDTVAEGITVPEEIRGKIPTDYGRSKGVAWYALLGFGITHNATASSKNPQNRIMVWDSEVYS